MTRLAEPRRSRVDQPSTDGASLSAYGKARSTIAGEPLSKEDLRKLHAFWRACNYLMLGMIYLKDNPLLRKKPLKSSTSSRGCSGTGAPAPAWRSSICT